MAETPVRSWSMLEIRDAVDQDIADMAKCHKLPDPKATPKSSETMLATLMKDMKGAKDHRHGFIRRVCVPACTTGKIAGYTVWRSATSMSYPMEANFENYAKYIESKGGQSTKIDCTKPHWVVSKIETLREFDKGDVVDALLQDGISRLPGKCVTILYAEDELLPVYEKLGFYKQARAPGQGQHMLRDMEVPEATYKGIRKAASYS